jgi:hypothetical protein
MGKSLVEYVRRPVGPLFNDFDNRNKFVNAVMKEFKGKKAVTPVEKLVKSYINNQKVGVIMAIPEADGFVNVTYAQWDDRHDVYDKATMVEIAIERGERFLGKPADFVPKVPYEIAAKLPAFMHRAKRYFKTARFPVWTYLYFIPEEEVPAK